LDHTTPYDQGGPTCKCNIGGVCRTHHQVKQLPGWSLQQTAPGVFQWTTPGGRVYTTTPDIHPL
ncbi:MAG: HNH endonuclease, partial [Actinomycetota bacterium]